MRSASEGSRRFANALPLYCYQSLLLAFGMDRQKIYALLYEYQRAHPGFNACCSRKGKGQYRRLFRKFGNVQKLSYDQWLKRNAWMFRPDLQDNYCYFTPLPTPPHFARTSKNTR